MDSPTVCAQHEPNAVIDYFVRPPNDEIHAIEKQPPAPIFDLLPLPDKREPVHS